jgi:hypothetical protein
MKRIYFLIYFTILTGLLVSSCSDTATYAELLSSEKTLIKEYIKRNGINVINSFPADSVWGPNDYVLTSSGLYIRIENYGSTKDTVTVTSGCTIVPRYEKYTLEAVSDTISDWSTIDFPYPETFVYGTTSTTIPTSCTAFQEAAYYLHKNDAEARIIVTSKIGFNADMLSVTPYGYHLKIKIQK